MCSDFIRNKNINLAVVYDKDLHVGDELEFINKETLKIFGTAIITKLETKTLGTLEESDWGGHERFASDKIMYQTYRSYYGDRVNPDTAVKLLQFTFLHQPNNSYTIWRHPLAFLAFLAYS